jgi:parallel beta-helix repeat protein
MPIQGHSQTPRSQTTQSAQRLFRPLALSSLTVATGVLLTLGHSPTTPAWSNPSQAMQLAQVPIGATVLNVNPLAGSDVVGGGSTATPLKTIAFALTQVKTGVPTVVQLAPGSYTADSGETFPLKVKPNVTLLGDESTKGQGILIQGTGKLLTKALGSQDATISLDKNSVLRGVTVTNLASRGTGVWVESTNPVIANNTFTNTGREGIFITGQGTPIIGSNLFIKNTGNGVSTLNAAAGTVTNNLFQENGYGLAIGGNSTTLVENNQITKNIAGFYINADALPVLRGNAITENKEDGILITTRANPDLGTVTTNGKNIVRGNNTSKKTGVFDINNVTKNTIAAVGNDIDKTAGSIDFTAITVPTPTPIPTPLPTVTPTPLPTVSPLPTPTISPLPTPTISPTPTPLPTITPTPLPTVSPTPTPTATPGAVSFKDVPANHWARGFIETLAAQGVISGVGDGNFRPDAPVTRAQFAALINKAYAPAPVRAAIDFGDVPSSYWAFSAIQTASKGGYMAGYADGTFKPEQNIPRVQLVVAIANGVGYGRQPADQTLLSKLSDGATIPDYGKNPVAAAMKRNILVNFPTPAAFAPNRPATRAEVAALIYQSLVDLGRVPVINSPYIFKP